MALRSLAPIFLFLHVFVQSQESGITEPISGGEVRDKQDQYKGMGIEKVNGSVRRMLRFKSGISRIRLKTFARCVQEVTTRGSRITRANKRAVFNASFILATLYVFRSMDFLCCKCE